ncbi:MULTISPECIES: DUF2798 domain-containing protein [unclassified Yoonia]|uniref:DUF2798 domain-containing protein n=1 Tax=unclassified Yoonia TaxID=2629118 RepID=UPI002AFE587D|nr:MULTISPECIES: DUF2798 domain-containing protein [unclassified Yoonia]
MPKKTLITAQIIITFLMATLMSGTMSLIHMGFSMEWLAAWPLQMLTAWPIAFVFGMGVTPFAFAMATRLTQDRQPAL